MDLVASKPPRNWLRPLFASSIRAVLMRSVGVTAATLSTARQHAREDAAPGRQHTALVDETIADGIEGQEAHTGLEGSTQDQRRAAGIDGAHAVGARYLGDGSERVPGATPARSPIGELRARLRKLEGIGHGRLDAASDSACEQGDCCRWGVLLLRRR
jgi:hypothetical protein